MCADLIIFWFNAMTVFMLINIIFMLTYVLTTGTCKLWTGVLNSKKYTEVINIMGDPNILVSPSIRLL